MAKKTKTESDTKQGANETQQSMQTRIKKKAMLEALEKSLGNVTAAVRHLGGSMVRSTHYAWMKDDPEYKAAVEELLNVTLDFVESKMYERIKGVIVKGKKGNLYKVPPSETLIKFVLSTKGKQRGYIERKEITGAEGEPLKVVQVLPDPDITQED
jgi:hypothetical protein